jgi:hypothetical protein
LSKYIFGQLGKESLLYGKGATIWHVNDTYPLHKAQVIIAKYFMGFAFVK